MKAGRGLLGMWRGAMEQREGDQRGNKEMNLIKVHYIHV
jgi:hypothetical protein